SSMTVSQAFTTRLTSLAELGAIFDIDSEVDVGDPAGQNLAVVTPGSAHASESTDTAIPDQEDSPPTLAALLAELDVAGASLATIARRDESARECALGELARHDMLVAAQREAE